MTNRGEKAFPGEVVTAVIPNGATGLSGEIWLNGFLLSAIQMPSTWVTANLTLQGSLDGVNFANVYDKSGNEVVLTAAASRLIQLNSSEFVHGYVKLKIRSGTAASPVNQTADRSLLLQLYPMS